LSYACFIRNRYVGICCPDDYLDSEESQSKPTTRRPQKPPKIPSRQSSNDGSDYTNGGQYSLLMAFISYLIFAIISYYSKIFN
jgi:hypothetical protein